MTQGTPLTRFGSRGWPLAGQHGKRILRAGRPNTPVGFLRQHGTTATRKHLLPMQRQAFLLILATLMASSAATAQAPPAQATPPAQTAPAPRNATGCAPTQSMPKQGTIAPQGTTTTDPRAEPLSDWQDPTACSARPQELTRKFAHQ